MRYVVLDTDVASRAIKDQLGDPMAARLTGTAWCVTSRAWDRISAAARRRGRPRPANDSWIAACCLAHQFALATFNVKDFEDSAAHDGLQLITASR